MAEGKWSGAFGKLITGLFFVLLVGGIGFFGGYFYSKNGHDMAVADTAYQAIREITAPVVIIPENITTGDELIDALNNVIDKAPDIIMKVQKGDKNASKQLDNIVDGLSKIDYSKIDLTPSQSIRLISMSGKLLPILKQVFPADTITTIGLLALLGGGN
ncbi:MAG: hypothetical protein LBM77_09140 [Spirochaetaceae bacterium]|jgi:hypothetical protein|nr:hypothetical protein [Spirochaetaceae bacterium]